MQQNAGALRPLTIITRPGSRLRAGMGRRRWLRGTMRLPCGSWTPWCAAMEHVVPHRLVAGGPTTSGLLAFAEPMPGGGWRLLYEVHGGGEGARRHDPRPAASATRVHMTNTSNTPAEMLEATYALRVERQAIRRDSGGAGAHRGGDGVVRS